MPVPWPAATKVPEKSHRSAVADAGALLDRHRRLVGRYRFAGEDRLVDAQAPRPDQAYVGGHPRPGFDEYEIAGNDRIGTDRDAMAVAQHGRLWVDHAADGFQRLRRLAFLDEADDRIGQRYRQHHTGIDPVAERRRKHRRCQQCVNEDIVKLEEETHERAAADCLRQPVRPEFRQPRGCLIAGQSVFAAGEGLHSRVGSKGVPRPLCDGGDRRTDRHGRNPACCLVHRSQRLRGTHHRDQMAHIYGAGCGFASALPARSQRVAPPSAANPAAAHRPPDRRLPVARRG